MVARLLPALALAVLMLGCASQDAASKDAAAGDLVACGFCGEKYPQADLTAHDGKMICKSCASEHQH